MSAVNRLRTRDRLRRSVLAVVQKKAEADLNNEALLENIVRETHRRMALQGFKGDKEPLPFLRGLHEASGDYMRELRCCLGISQYKMARLLKIGPDVVSRYERKLDSLGANARERLVTVGRKYAADGVKPEIPNEDYSGGLGDRDKPRLSKVNLPREIPAVESRKMAAFNKSPAIKDAVESRDAGAAFKELGIGFMLGLAGVGIFLMLAGAAIFALGNALAP